MPLYRATIEILVSADCADQACDGISETLRDTIHNSGGFFLDWQYATENKEYLSPHLIDRETAETEFPESVPPKP